MLKLYNTLSKKIEEVQKPTGRKLNMYSCGPTIYNYAHIGNLRSFVLADLLYRTLKYDGYEPRWVMNLTDIDDKTIKGAIEKFGKDATVQDLHSFTEVYKEAFINDLREVNVLVGEIELIRVTDRMPDIQKFIMDLLEKGYAYKAEDGSTYFSIEKYQQDFGDYGQLVGEKFLEGKKVGARVAVDEYEKDNLSDFALWKKHNPETDGNIFWPHEVLGNGRPGWHIECSVINKVAFNGEPTDIHTGGVDLIFPHHTNEIAQSQALAGKGNFVHHWFHSEHLLVDGKKMSKSLGNFYTLADLNHMYEGSSLPLRHLLLQSNFDVQQNFTKASLAASHHRVRHLQTMVGIASQPAGINKNYVDDVVEHMNNNLNSARALGELSNVFNEIFTKTGEVGTLLELDKIFGLNLKLSEDGEEESLPEKVEQLLAERQAARDMKDFQRSDELRLKIAALGFEVKDTPEGREPHKK